MPIINRIKAGKKAQQTGMMFENWLKNAAFRRRWTCTRIPDGCRQMRGKIVRIKSPFDFVFTRFGKAVFADAKTVNQKTFAYSQIKLHQLIYLKSIEEDGFPAGYIIYFQPLDKVVFFSATKLISIRQRESVSVDDGILCGNWETLNLHLIFEQLKEHQSTQVQNHQEKKLNTQAGKVENHPSLQQLNLVESEDISQVPSEQPLPSDSCGS